MTADDGRLFGVRMLVYGAANGVGEAIARLCARNDAKVIAVDTASSDVEHRFRSVPGVEGHALEKNASDPAPAIDAAADALGGLDAVVYAAGLQPSQPVAEAAAKDKLVEARLTDVHKVFDAAHEHQQLSPGGRFIVIGLLRSAFTRDAQILCEAAEQALASQVRKLAAGAGQHGITVNYIQPGAIMTPESRRIFVADKALRDHCIKQSAAQRLGESLDVAKAALFLASDDATFVSGTGIRVDGGSSR